METILSTQNLHRRYGGSGTQGYDAVRGIDLEVTRGEVFALLGTNGAGKTSTLEMLEGLARPSEGTVRVFDLDPVAQCSQVRSRTGIVLQEVGYPAQIRTAEMARTWAATLSRPRPVAQVLDAVGLGHRAGVEVSSLSGGERRRLDLALALLGDPELLFLDEPTTGLDPASRRDAWALISELVAAGTSVVLTTHYLEEAEQLADRIAIMHGGRIVSEGTPEQIVAGAPARIAFTLPALAPALPPLLGQVSTARRADQARHEVRTRDLQGDLRALLDWAAGHRLELAGLDARAASLEQIFLDISGHPATDSQEQAA